MRAAGNPLSGATPAVTLGSGRSADRCAVAEPGCGPFGALALGGGAG